MQGDFVFFEMNGNGVVVFMDFIMVIEDQFINLCDKFLLVMGFGIFFYFFDGCGVDGLWS